jgi:hypothetical protein
MPLIRRFRFRSHQGKCAMDIAMLGIVAVFFALCFAYTKACDRL